MQVVAQQGRAGWGTALATAVQAAAAAAAAAVASVVGLLLHHGAGGGLPAPLVGGGGVRWLLVSASFVLAGPLGGCPACLDPDWRHLAPSLMAAMLSIDPEACAAARGIMGAAI